MIRLLAVGLLTLLAVGAEVQLELNQIVSLQVTRDQPVSLTLSLNASTQDYDLPAVRVSVQSKAAVSHQPLLVTVRQARQVSSWRLPYVEAGYAHHSVNHTLCPLWNHVPQSSDPLQIIFDVSTSSSVLINFTLSTTTVEQFYIRLNQPITLTASPSAPSYASFYYHGNVDRVRVKFTSSGSGRQLCAVAAVQKSMCPVTELLDGPDGNGVHQTMQHLAAITTQLERATNTSETPPKFLHVVVSVFSDNSKCSSSHRKLADSITGPSDKVNFDPEPYVKQKREKTVTIVIEPALTADSYALATVTATVVYLSIYVLALIWMTVNEWWRWSTHPTVRHLRQCESVDLVPSVQGVEDGSGEGGEREGVDAPVVQGAQDQEPQRQRVNCQMSPKRPSWWRVLIGSHWKKIQEQQREMTARSSFDPTQSLPASFSSPHSPSRSRRALSQFKMQRTPSGTYYFPHTSLHTHHHPPSTHSTPRAGSFRDTSSIHTAQSLRDQTDQLDGVPSAAGDHTPDGPRGHLRRHSSYELACYSSPLGARDAQSQSDKPHRYMYDSEPLPVNLVISELKFEECTEDHSHSQYSWYLTTAIIFYGIPAIQLVTAYQQILSITGNEDVCYYNTLCSHPHTIGSFTISSFNNVFSNIGFLLLGLLLACITYRRKREHTAMYYHHNYKLPPHKRLGVPQYHGIYYAISLALIAEAFMSATYHLCPTSNNYQFDTTYMFIMAGLGIYQVVSRRSPDIILSVYKGFLILAAMITLAVIGVVYSDSAFFYPIFFVAYLLVTVWVSVEVYYRWQLGWPWRYPGDYYAWLENIIRDRKKLWKVKHKPKMMVLIVTNLGNMAIALYGIAARPPDFGSYFLFILVSNFGLYLICYGVTKVIYKEWQMECSLLPVVGDALKPVLYCISALIIWICALVYYREAVTDWLESPAGSRNGNKECILLGFYDSHDLWHFLSSLALFFSFMMLMSLDDSKKTTPRSELHVF